MRLDLAIKKTVFANYGFSLGQTLNNIDFPFLPNEIEQLSDIFHLKTQNLNTLCSSHLNFETLGNLNSSLVAKKGLIKITIPKKLLELDISLN